MKLEEDHIYYGGNFCSLMQCQDDWFNKFGTRAIDHFGRIHEPKRTKLRRLGIKIMIMTITRMDQG